MTDKKDGPAAGADRSTGEGTAKRPFATIDLKATEVKVSVANTAGANTSGANTSGANTSGASAASAGATGAGGLSQTAGQTAAAEKVVAAARSSAAGSSSAAGGSTAAKSAAAPAAAKSEATAEPGSKTAAGRTGAATSVPKSAAASDTAMRATAGAASSASSASESATATAAKAPIAASVPKARGGLISHMGAGIAGGVLAMLGLPYVAPLLGLDQLGPAPTVVTGIAPDYVARLAVLEKQVRERLASPASVSGASKSPADSARLDDLTRQIGALAEGQAKLQSDNAVLRDELAKQASLKDAGDRLAKMEEQLNGMVAAATADPQKAGRLPQLANLTAQVADLKSALDTRLAAHRKDLAQEIDARVAPAATAAETAIAGAKRLDGEVAVVRSETTRLADRLEQLKASGDRLDQSLKSVKDEQAAVKAALDGYKNDVGGQLKSTARLNDVAMALAPVAAKVTALESSVQGVLKAEVDRKSNAERIVLSLELGNLKRAMDRGQKYATELDEVKKNAGGKLNLAVLERFQNQGVPTIVDLAKAFRPLANAILDAEAEPANQSMVDRLLTSAKTVVRVRKTSYSPDDVSAEAVVARMETALKESRLGDVLAEAKTLPAKALLPAKQWLAQVEARYAVEAELASIDLALKSSLGAGPGAADQKGGK